MVPSLVTARIVYLGRNFLSISFSLYFSYQVFRPKTPTSRISYRLTTGLEYSGQQVTQTIPPDPWDYNDEPIRIWENQDPIIPRRPVPRSESPSHSARNLFRSSGSPIK